MKITKNNTTYIPFEPNKNFILENKLGNTKYFPVAIREWKNSSYNFNKSSQRNVASKDNMVNKLIKSYFYFSDIKNTPRSKRMRSLRRKFTSKKIFTSRPEIKQTNDKVIVTLFTFNREKQFLLKKLFYYNRRRTVVDLWRKNNKLIPYTEQYKNLNYLIINENKDKTVNYTVIDNITKNIIKQDSYLYTQFKSDLISNKDKINLYKKIYDKVSRNINKSSIFENNKNNRNNLFLSNSKIKSYKLKRSNFFKKKMRTIKNLWYVRKKMKGLNPSITKKRGKRSNKRVISYSGIKMRNEMNFLSFKSLLYNKNLAYASKLFYFYFLKYILSMFNIKVYAYSNNNLLYKNTMNNIVYTNEISNIERKLKKDRKGKRNKKSKFSYNINKNALYLHEMPLSLISKSTNIKLYFYKINKDIETMNKIRITRTNRSSSKFISLSKPIIVNINILRNQDKINQLDNILSNINFIISQFLNKILTKSKILDKERKLYIIFQKYSKKYYKNFINRIEKKQKLLHKHYIRLMINRYKFSKWLPNLKLLIGKIYSKKTELNIINIKYPHLNSDIFGEVIGVKLRRRLNLLRVIKKALKLVKIPEGFKDKSKINIDYDLNKSSFLNVYKSLKFINLDKNNKIYQNNLQEILNKVYPKSLVNGSNYITNNIKHMDNTNVITSKLKNVLNIIKYKTLSGTRIEAAGRLTKRYTASRAVSKFRYKGSLKNLDYSNIIEHQKKGISAIMLRNQVKANSQYSFNNSKRRIGSFGIKGWISGY